ncbi:MAG: hypothetical protein LBF40_01055 [Deltaproteobacteria bacterium]|jgi:type II secretory pathway predicted ATPase ExeA|nr:hypothetical protein [Deltaproteobacteria bacterium]
MNYESFFGLRERPFRKAPQERFLFPRAPFLSLTQALSQEKKPRVVILSGGHGHGKSLSLLCLPFALGEGVELAIVSRGAPTLQGILTEALLSLGLAGTLPPDAPEETLLGIYQSVVSGLMDEGLSFVLAVDDAQRLSQDTLRDLESLVSLEPSWEGRATLLLAWEVGPTLPKAALSSKPLVFALGPLSEEELKGYVAHRLLVAGRKTKLFPQDALRALHSQGKGDTLLINDLAERALMTAWAAGKKEVSAAHVLQAKASLENPMRVREEGARVAAGLEAGRDRIRAMAGKTPLITLGAICLAALLVTGYLLIPKHDSESSEAALARGPVAAAKAPGPVAPPVPAGEAIPAAEPKAAPADGPGLGLPTPPSAILSLPRNGLALVVDRSITMSRLWQGGIAGPGLKAEVALPEISAPGLYLVGRPQSRTPLIFQYPPAKEIPKEASLRLWKQVESFLPQDILPLVVGEGPDLRKAAPAKLGDAIRDRLKAWTRSQELNLPDELASLYAPEFNFFEPGRKDRTILRENFRQALASEMRTSGEVRLTLSEPLILLDPRDHDRVWAVFSLKYDSKLRHDIGLRTLVFERRGGEWLVTAELWIKEVNLRT